MKVKVLYCVALLAALATGVAYADCKAPTAPRKLPNGKTATEQEMTEAGKVVKNLDAETNQYISCLQVEGEEQVARMEMSESDPKKREKEREKISKAMVRKQNAAVDVVTSLAQRYNEQVRAFKAKQNAQ